MISFNCNFPKCRNIPLLTYIGKNLCDKHWSALSNLSGEEEQLMLNKIGLLRLNGDVLKITPKRQKELENGKTKSQT